MGPGVSGGAGSSQALGELRIPMKPQTWLWILNLFIQPPMTALFVWLAMDPTVGGIGMRLFVLVMGACTGFLSVFTLLVLSRTIGRTFEIVLDDRTLRVPNVLRGVVDEIALASITTAKVHELATSGTSFFDLSIEAQNQKPVRIASQFVGTDSFHQLVDALRARGVQIG